MSEIKRVPVYGRDGKLGWVEIDPTVDETEDIRVWREGHESIWVPRNIIVTQADGSYYLPVTNDQIQPDPAATQPSDRHRVIPVIIEEAEISRRQIISNVRINKQVHEREELVDEPGFREEVEVKHIAINRVVDTPPEPRTEGDTLIIPVLEEVLVVEKRLILKEEVRITRQRQTIRNPQRVTLRSESIEIERSDPEEHML